MTKSPAVGLQGKQRIRMRTKVKTYAKINLTLNICGVTGGFHDIESLVTTIDLCDTVILSPRKDDKIVLKMRGAGEDIPPEKNNAYKAAKLFSETFKTGGADIEIVKRIPLAGGLGGSSADAAGVLNAMKKAYEIEDDMKPLADKLGSDTGYMLSGGFAVISGRGEKVKKIETDMKLHLVLIYGKNGVNTADCYKEFDLSGAGGILSDNEAAENSLKRGDVVGLCGEINNALYLPATNLNAEVKDNFDEMRSLSPLCSGMTGSGSSVFGIFETEELCRWAVEKLKKKDLDAEYVTTVNPSEKKLFGIFG